MAGLRGPTQPSHRQFCLFAKTRDRPRHGQWQRGHLGLAGDVLALAAMFREHWSSIGNTPLALAALDRAGGAGDAVADGAGAAGQAAGGVQGGGAGAAADLHVAGCYRARRSLELHGRSSRLNDGQQPRRVAGPSRP
jgi:hypothetical protein